LSFHKGDSINSIGEFKRKAVIDNHIDVLIEDFGANNPAIEASFFEEPVPAIVLKLISDSER
jgi:hypothetical protein